MTGNITKLSSSFLMTQVSMKNSGVNSGMQTDGASFSNFLKSSNQQNANAKNADSKSDQIGNVKYDNNRPQIKSTDRPNDANDAAQISNDTGNDTDKIEELTNEAVKDVCDEIKKTTEVDDEQLVEAMEVLGLSMIDLLQSANVSAVYEKLNGIEDSSELLTNENASAELSALLEDVSGITDDLLTKLGMTQEEFNAALESAVAKKDDTLGNEVLPVIENEVDAAVVEKDLDVKTEEPVVVIKDERKASDDNNNEKTENTEKTDEVINTTRRSEKSEDKESYSEQPGFAGTNQDNTEFVNELGRTESVNEYLSSQTEEIIKQIVSQIKITITQSASAMQMELHPESLGHVALSIESKGGVITAQFSAQNEVVKEAIESQISELRESIEAQGVKVEAVEVTVASHQFEENLSKNNQGEANQDQKNSGVHKNGRRLRLNLTEEIEDEELSEEERIIKELMEENGNSVDYTA